MPCPPPDLPNRGIKPTSPTLQVDPLPSEPSGKQGVKPEIMGTSQKEWPLLGRNIQTCSNGTFFVVASIKNRHSNLSARKEGWEGVILPLYSALQLAVVSFDPNFFESIEIQKALL